MSQWRDYRGNRSSLFDNLEAGRNVSSSYASGEIDEQENERDLDGLHDRVRMLKTLTTDIHEEAQSHSRLLDQMGSGMDTARGMLSGTVDRFKRVFETKSGRNMFTIVASFLLVFLLIYFMVK
ncbi:hypothetical protein SELMODRAFT_170735 [Selaginella moellendorffii]|uniref:t-SNARE coiled-coil homology domain-containing protein n=1 Tax=Selaginella moellendorffii TaxID=88036 RepID=D8REG1_SELML|nr:bet1-like SNARE 1-1 [Selaginella moellendorffii]XP_002970830.1 bet1-like SNARE 1-1 [Selaginella moellendorffii]EFJ28156.1 hypothetical protein SELMODRAFT_147316 [Selaginella moellendorffii]EFJ29650.1 hypothetical protein SELMODRAFT_170735 [Selaginella moellendorffii]|eukprot:XP_002969562.1 bet1-like SNARE 1-1 [Selaginella moellendorffii]